MDLILFCDKPKLSTVNILLDKVFALCLVLNRVVFIVQSHYFLVALPVDTCATYSFRVLNDDSFLILR